MNEEIEVKRKVFTVIEQIGEQRYQVIYNYVLKKSLEIKKEELTSINNNSQKLTNFLDELQLFFHHLWILLQLRQDSIH